MKIKFNKFERVAGLFVLTAILGGFAFLVSVAVKQGWFDSKVFYSTQFESAEGLHPGTRVQIAGLIAGSVESVDLMTDNRVQVHFSVLSKFEDKVRADSVVQLIRPFIIGERVLDISTGSPDAELIRSGGRLASRESMDLMSLISGKNLGQSLEAMASMLSNFKHLAESLLDKDRTQALITMFDRVDPLLKNLNVMSLEVIKLSRQASKDENLGVVLGQLATTTKELNKMLPELSQKAPEMAKNVESVVRNMALLTDQFKVLIPALAEVAPELPAASRRALEALDEAVVLMKAMQKSFFVKSNAVEVREEEAQEIKQGKRRPANLKR